MHARFRWQAPVTPRRSWPTRGWLVVFLLALPAAAGAHPLGNFSINHYAAIAVRAEAIELRYVIDMAEIPTFQELQEVRSAGPGDLTPAEGAALAARKADEWRAGLVLSVNGERLALTASEIGFALTPGAGGLPTLRVTATYRAALGSARLGAMNRLRYEDRNYPGRAGWKEVVVPGTSGIVPASSSVSATDRSKALTDYPAGMLNSPPQDLAADVTFAAAAAPEGVAASTAPGATVPAATGGGRPRGDRFTALMSASELTPGFIGFALVVAFALGAFHALEPGHGKTVVAAYLVGSRGTVLHAVLLGTIVTASHTAGVFLLGLVTLYASRYVVPERLYPWLGFASGLLIVGLSLSLLRRRQRELAHARGHEQHAHPHEDEHGHACAPQHAHEHAHPQAHAHAHHDHTHAPDHPHGPAGHRHGHGHHHQHVPPDGQVTLGSLLALGISGGIIPCPAALVVLLSAMALRRIGFGLILIVAFSLGLAVVLVAIGILMVHARRLLERFRWKGGGWLQRLPLASSLAMALLGLGIAIQSLAGR